ncbi:MAG TPA: phosphoribosylformylglycinamidine synthase subunit PurL [archaeon]|nr:phosphoribosylformylglycinamidine synthase subunit PurL [archaeon]
MDEIKISNLQDQELLLLSKKMLLSLDLNEMKTIKTYYKKLAREPTRIEIETLAQTWSEHCKHKTFNAQINYAENGENKKINSLFKTYIKAATEKSKKTWLVSVFSDNAGIIKFNSKYNIAMKAETHNHPSALDPYGGANTGVGGVIRDILGAGLGAKPFANTDVFCFAPHDMQKEKVPRGVLHPKRIFKGVRSGVADYGNRIGIPTVNGAIIFDEGYVANPLVYCGTVGLIPKGMEKKKAKPGDKIVVLGARTGRDGIHGATFSSIDLNESASSSAVQIGNPIEERKMMDALIKARDQKLYSAITDCGAGGFSSAIGEMGCQIGARVDLEKAPLKYKGLSAWEIWVSESQERMVLSVPEKNLQKLSEICEIEGTQMAVIGEFTNTKKLELFYNNELLGEIKMEFLHQGLPQKQMNAKWNTKAQKEIRNLPPTNYGQILKQLLAMPNIASKESTVRKYDHEVGGGTVGKPFVGEQNDCPADAAIVRPLLDDWAGAVISNGINPLYSKLDPYHMATLSIDEAIRNALCVGAHFESIVLLDNFCWANPEREETLGELVRACMGCYDASVAFKTPFISGKDSLYNEYNSENSKIAIPGTLLISALGIITDSKKKVSMPFKHAANPIYILGNTYCELGASHFGKLIGSTAGSIPKVRFKDAVKTFSKLSALLKKQNPNSKIIKACHDCSEGGIAVAISEMAFSNTLGAQIDLRKMRVGERTSREDFILFSESPSRFIVEVDISQKKKFEDAMKGVVFSQIGTVTKNGKLQITGLAGTKIIDEQISTLKAAWKKTLGW